jgi:ABC-type multidrug transport system fused ATPase/permease subunit
LFFATCRILTIAPFPVIFKVIIDNYMPQKNGMGVLWVSLAMIVLLVAHQYFSVMGGQRLGQAVAMMILDLRGRVLDKVLLLSQSYLDRQKTGRLLSKYAFDTQKIEGVALPILNMFIPNSLYSLLTLAILVAMNWKLSVVILLLLPIISIMRTRYFDRLQKSNEDNRRSQERLTAVSTEFFGALRLIRSYGEENRAQGQLNVTNQEVVDSRIRMVRWSSSFAAFSWGYVQFLSLVVVAGGALLSINGRVTSGTVLLFMAGLPALVQPIQMISMMADQYFLGREAYKSIKELLDERDVEQWRGTKTLPSIRGRIEFDQVCFRYPEADRDALTDFTLTIEPGQRIALVGSSGAGKSTVASILLGLYASNKGEVRIDSLSQQDMDIRWFRRNIAIVMQESLLLSGTIEDNIRFGRPDASDQDVRDAARRANAEQFILGMPQGFKTVVGERGVMLSGGQRQRISIARALLRNPAILILDEPTSALDYESERLIQQALDELIQGRTVITIAHRLSTIRNADRIIVMHEGRIVESGSFAQLWELQGHFHRMLTAQEITLTGETPATASPDQEEPAPAR